MTEGFKIINMDLSFWGKNNHKQKFTLFGHHILHQTRFCMKVTPLARVNLKWKGAWEQPVILKTGTCSSSSKMTLYSFPWFCGRTCVHITRLGGPSKAILGIVPSFTANIVAASIIDVGLQLCEVQKSGILVFHLYQKSLFLKNVIFLYFMFLEAVCLLLVKGSWTCPLMYVCRVKSLIADLDNTQMFIRVYILYLYIYRLFMVVVLSCLSLNIFIL